MGTILGILTCSIVFPSLHHDQPGRPSAGAVPKHYTYHPTATLILNQAAVALQRNQAGRFILASNLLELEDQGQTQLPEQTLTPPNDNSSPPEHDWCNDRILQEYKEQQSCERGFRFLKDPLFFASRVFVQKAQRLAILAMIMGLCLLVYTFNR